MFLFRCGVPRNPNLDADVTRPMWDAASTPSGIFGAGSRESFGNCGFTSEVPGASSLRRSHHHGHGGMGGVPPGGMRRRTCNILGNISEGFPEFWTEVDPDEEAAGMAAVGELHVAKAASVRGGAPEFLPAGILGALLKLQSGRGCPCAPWRSGFPQPGGVPPGQAAAGGAGGGAVPAGPGGSGKVWPSAGWMTGEPRVPPELEGALPGVGGPLGAEDRRRRVLGGWR